MYNTRTTIVPLNKKHFILPRHKETPQHSIFAPDRRSFELNQIPNQYGSFSFYRLYRKNQRQLEEERRERLRQKTLHAKEPLNRNRGNQNNLKRGKPTIVADYKNGSNH